jgi:hypothetical protein
LALPNCLMGISAEEALYNKSIRKEVIMSSGAVHFPNGEVMRKFLSHHELLSHELYQKKGITEVVAKLAVVRFADSVKMERGIKLEVAQMIQDFQEEEEVILKIELSHLSWDTLSRALEIALIDCAKIVREESKESF